MAVTEEKSFPEKVKKSTVVTTGFELAQRSNEENFHQID